MTALTLITFGLATYYLLPHLKSIRRFHGAEHKVLESYLKHGSIDDEQILLTSRISDRCGGKLLLPLLIAGPLSVYLSQQTHFNLVLTNLAMVEIILGIDFLIKWSKIPVFAQASRAIQYMTTGEPGEHELQTAKTALIGLIEAHELKSSLQVESIHSGDCSAIR